MQPERFGMSNSSVFKALTPKALARLMTATALMIVPLAAQAQNRPALPEGEAKVLVEGMCTLCHQTNQITSSMGYTREGWKELTGTMLDLSGNADMRDKLIDYLATHYPPNTRRQPTLVSGSAQISLKEWTMPRLGQRSRDPIQAADGLIWYAGQFGNLMGSINPATGEIKEYELPDNSKPHTVEIDPKGNIWYTGNANGTLGYLDPKTGKITVFKMPDSKAKDPHTLVFDKNGTGWFTLQNSNMVGRIDPASGDIKLTTLSTPDSKPYGIKIDAQGNPWFSCNGRPCLYKINPATMGLTEVKLPLEGTTVRRLDIAEDGMIWYVNSGLGRLGRYNPKTGEIKEWPSPSGPKSHPYAIAVVDGMVWYNESGMRPDPLVRFDPKTETFQSWAIPSGNIYAGIVRHMRGTRDGSLLIHQSSTNRIIQVTVTRRAASR
jgi:virginiamycin B lyase